MTAAVTFVAPEPRASISGGNLYNWKLMDALAACGVNVARVSVDDSRPRGACVVDSLHLDALPRFAPCHLLAHYLPSLVAGTAPTAVERAAITTATSVLVPSAFLRDVIRRIAPDQPVTIVAPGIDVAHAPLAPTSRAVMLANLVPGKGVLPFLRALGANRFALAIIGRLDADATYADECRSAAPWADFLGALSHPEAMTELAASDFLVSASRMESFGLALAEARALGVPILARRGGNVAALVDEAAGGRLVDDDEGLASECRRLSGDAAELARRRAAARAHRPPAREWSAAARDFVAALAATA